MVQLLSIPAAKVSIPALAFLGLTIPTYPLVTEGGVSTELFIFIVSAMASAIVALGGVMQRYYVKRIAELEVKTDAQDKLIQELRTTLSGYGAVGPELVQQIELLIRQAGINGAPKPPDSSHTPTSLPFPYETSRPTRPRRGKIGGPQ